MKARVLVGVCSLVAVFAFGAALEAQPPENPKDLVSVSSFKVEIEGMESELFESVSGIGIDLEDMAFHGDKRLNASPGRFDGRDITLVRRFKKDKALYEWLKAIKSGKELRRDGRVLLLDDEGKEVARFEFKGAWPKVWSGPSLSKDRKGEDVLKEEIVLSVQSVEMK
jgi:phage tail-like protein